MKFIKNKTKDKGYAILFTVIVVGIVSMITIGLSNAAYKQIILSSIAKDSTTAFYQADIASECALYADYEYNMEPADNLWTCAEHSLKFSRSGSGQVTTYHMNQINPTSTDKCFSANVTRTETESSVSTKIEALGYNICDQTNIRTVERAIQVNY